MIPAQATAKLSFRLVPGQSPRKILDGLHRFVEERLPADASASFSGEGGSPAVGFDTRAPAFRAASRALEAEWGKQPMIVGCGASIPIVEFVPLARSTWTRSLSASPLTTTASTPQMRNTICGASTKARGAGRASWPSLVRCDVSDLGRPPLPHRAVGSAARASAARVPPRNTPGAFDYYVLVLSWSPSYCRSEGRERNDGQCSIKPHAFMLHGLWPQYEKGWPEDCPNGKRPWVPSIGDRGHARHHAEQEPHHP